jgi:hypothetical protein
MYDQVGREFQAHESVNHHAGEYVRGSVSINKAENFFSQLKRSLDGTHHRVSPEHMHRYVAEFGYRCEMCKMSDTDRTIKFMGQAGDCRLSYKRVTR